MSDEIFGFPIIRAASPGQQTRKYKQGDLETLKSCDDISTYSECGYYCVSGFRSGDLKIHLHFNNAGEWSYLLASSGLEHRGKTLVENPAARRELWGREKNYRTASHEYPY